MNPNFMKKALDLAVENVKNGAGGPFGAVIVKDNKIIAEGTNRVTSKNDPTAHAEINAIRAACKHLNTFSLKGCEIYTSCEPCPMCLSAIYWSRLDKIYFAGTKIDAAIAGFDDDFIYRELALLPQQRKLPIQRLMQDEGFEPFDTWMKSEGKIKY